MFVGSGWFVGGGSEQRTAGYGVIQGDVYTEANSFFFQYNFWKEIEKIFYIPFFHSLSADHFSCHLHPIWRRSAGPVQLRSQRSAGTALLPARYIQMIASSNHKSPKEKTIARHLLKNMKYCGGRVGGLDATSDQMKNVLIKAECMEIEYSLKLLSFG